MREVKSRESSRVPGEARKVQRVRESMRKSSQSMYAGAGPNET